MTEVGRSAKFTTVDHVAGLLAAGKWSGGTEVGPVLATFILVHVRSV
jgi:hypothetical protein